jgi:hypothetical protein
METQITAKVTFPDWDSDAPFMQDMIAKAAADTLLNGEGMRRRINEQIQRQVEKRVLELVSQLFQRETSPSDGTPSLAEVLTADVEKWLNQRVNVTGRAEGLVRNKTRLQWLLLQTYRAHYREHVEQMIREAMEELDEEIDKQFKLDEEIDKQFKSHIKELITSVLTRA